MTANDILSELTRRGVRLEVVGDRIRWRPKEAVPEELVEGLKRLKSEIIAELSRESQSGLGLCPGPTHCGGCYEVSPNKWMHPPRVPEKWRAWLENWQPDGKGRLQ